MDAMTVAVLAGSAAAFSAFVLGLVALAASRAPGWRSLRWFAFVAFSAAGYAVFDLGVVLDVPPVARSLGVQLALTCAVLQAIAWVGYLAASNGRPLRRRHRMFFAAGGIVVVLGLVPGLFVTRAISLVSIDWLGVTYHTPALSTFGNIVYVFWIATFAWVAFFWDRDPTSWGRSIGAGSLGLLALNDTLVTAGMLPMPLMLDYGSVLLIMWASVDHQRRFVLDAKRLVQLSTTLESEVAARTRELGRAEEALRKSELLAGLGRMASGVAHEINNPAAVLQYRLEYLRSVLEELESVADVDIPAEAHTSVDEGLRAVQAIARTVRQLLDVGSSERAASVRAASCQLATIVDGALGTLRITRPNARVVVEVSPDLDVQGDRDAIEQALLNVLANACDAIQRTPASGTVRVAAARSGDSIRVTVEDDGPGIAPEVRARLFEPFVTTKPVGQGTGLGLSLARGLVRSQGGDLVLVASSSGGTTMALQLLRADSRGGAPERAQAPAKQKVDRRDELVYVVDDEEDLLEVFRLMIEPRFRVAVFQTVAGALEAARRERPDVVLCDVMMADGGAEAWLAECSGIDPTLRDRTIVLTGGPTTREAGVLVETHRDRTLYKPCEMRTLLEAVERVIA